MYKFPHLKFSENLIGKARFTGGGKPNQLSSQNKKNREDHSQKLLSKTNKLNTEWQKNILDRQIQNLAPLSENIEPIFLRVNPSLLDNLGFHLETYNIEIISQEDDGYIIGASLDNLKTLEEKIRLFSQKKRGGGKIADFWEIIDGDRESWKPKHILSTELFNKWDSISDFYVYKVEVSIAFDKPISSEPDVNKRGGAKRLEKYKTKLIERDFFLTERQEHFENFIQFYGNIESSFIELGDSFACEVSITGKGLKDLVLNYPFVFEVRETEKIIGENSYNTNELNAQLEIIAPPIDATEVGIIDSGIMENHILLEKAIIPSNSKSYLNGVNSVADKVANGGHGTKVAGAVLFPRGVTNLTSPYQLPCFVRNLRVLNDQNELEHNFPAELMKIIVEQNPDCFIYNLSITSKKSYNLKHMSSWASMLDKLIHEKEILFFHSSGKILKHIQ